MNLAFSMKFQPSAVRYNPKQWPSKIANFGFVEILRSQIWKMSLKSMKTLGNDVFRSGWYWDSIAQSENRLITKISVRNFRIVYFLSIFVKYPFCLATVLSYTSLLRAGMSWKTPDSCVSHNVDIFRRKNYQKILSFKKVTSFSRKDNFFLKILTKNQFWATT